LLGRNYLKGELGDALNPILCSAGHNIRMILRQLRIFGFIFGRHSGLDHNLRPVSKILGQPDAGWGYGFLAFSGTTI